MPPKIKDAPGQLLLIKNDPNVYIRCRVCGRVLRHPASVAAGIGPSCRRRERQNESVKLHATAARTLERDSQAG